MTGYPFTVLMSRADLACYNLCMGTQSRGIDILCPSRSQLTHGRTQAPRDWGKAGKNGKRLDYSEPADGSVSDGGVHTSAEDLSKLSLVDQSDEEAGEPLSEEEGETELHIYPWLLRLYAEFACKPTAQIRFCKV